MGGQNSSISQLVQQNNLPSWENSAYQNVASQAAGQVYDPATGLPNGLPALHGIAGESPALSNYVNEAQGAPFAGTQMAGLNAFNGYQSNVGASPVNSQNWDTTTAQRYMNPYTNTVLQTQQQLANQQFGQQQAGLNQQAAASGALGGDRNAVAQSSLLNDFNLQQQNLQANALQSAYTTGQTAFNNDANRNLQAGVENSQLGLAAAIQNANLNFGAKNSTNQLNEAGTALNMQGLGVLGQAGGVDQSYKQSIADNSYQNALNQYLFPEQQNQYLEGILNGIPNQMTNQTDVYGANGNPISQAVGAAAAGTKPGVSVGAGGGSQPGPGPGPGQTTYPNYSGPTNPTPIPYQQPQIDTPPNLGNIYPTNDPLAQYGSYSGVVGDPNYSYTNDYNTNGLQGYLDNLPSPTSPGSNLMPAGTYTQDLGNYPSVNDVNTPSYFSGMNPYDPMSSYGYDTSYADWPSGGGSGSVFGG